MSKTITIIPIPAAEDRPAHARLGASSGGEIPSYWEAAEWLSPDIGLSERIGGELRRGARTLLLRLVEAEVSSALVQGAILDPLKVEEFFLQRLALQRLEEGEE